VADLVAAERIPVAAELLLPLSRARLLAELLHEAFGHGLAGLLQGLERLTLGADGLAGKALAQRLDGLLHRSFRTAERQRNVARHLAEAPHHIAEPPAQRLLHRGVALQALGTLLRCVTAGLLALLRLLEAAVEQLLLAPGQF